MRVASAEQLQLEDQLAPLQLSLDPRVLWPDIGRASLDAALAAMDAALAAGDLRGWATADADFHRRLVVASGNRRLATTVAGMADLAHRARLATLRLRPMPQQSNQEHHALVTAIRNRDPARAEALHTRHRRRVGALLVLLLADLPGDGA